MAKIPLRQYNREIETLIDRGQTEEAIAHCRHILQTYPKYIEAYRLLGKAFLESQRFGEAADIFQRVLACVPDDFVSQIGMSIIREDEGNLDAALWHMERAFEVQPANSAVQGELRRLYGRRDGLEPPKIRLTRGALVRMYARGDLYQQAIAECRVALAEDPQRPDLQGIMARMHALAGQKVEAADICSSVLAKYPYNFEANRILSEILPGTARAEDSQAYKQRIVALEPYLGLMPPDGILVSEVPDNAVIVDRLDWNPLEGTAPAQPQWAESLGIQFQQPGDQEAMPEWLSPQTEPEQNAPTEISPGFQAAADTIDQPSAPASVIPGLAGEPEESQIPEWMKDAGWVPSDGTVSEQPVPISESEETEGDLAPADIPDWLRDMAPEETPGQPVEPQIDNLIEDNTPISPASTELEGIPDWLENFGAETAEGATAEPLAAEGMADAADFDWLKDFESGGQTSAAVPAIDETDQEEDGTQSQPAGDPDWFSEAAQTVEEPETISRVDADAPVVGGESVPSPEEPQQGFAPPDDTDQDAALAWLESLAAKHGADEEVLFTKPEDRVDVPPDWVQEAADAAPAQAAGLPENEVPEWLDSLAASEISESPIAEEHLQATELSGPTAPEAGWGAEIFSTDVEVTRAEPAQPGTEAPAEELPSWLAGDPSTAAAEADEALPAQDIPDWLAGLAPAATIEADAEAAVPDEGIAAATSWLETIDAEQPAVSVQEPDETEDALPPATDLPVVQEVAGFEPQPEPEVHQIAQAGSAIPDLNDQDAALAWLESLAAKQGADEEVLFTKPEERTETPPDWVLENAADEPAAVQAGQPVENGDQLAPDTVEPAAIPDMPEAVSEAAMTSPEPDWLADLTASEPEPDEQSSAAAQSFEPPAWLKEEDMAQAAGESSHPDWLAGMAEDEQQAESEAEPGELPAWLQGMKEDQQVADTSVREQSESPTDDLAGWLQGLQSQPGETEEQPDETQALPTEEGAAEAEDPVKLPDWLKQYEEPVQDTSNTIPPVIPTWVDEVEAETAQPVIEEAPQSPVPEPEIEPDAIVHPQTYTQPLQSPAPEFPLVEKIPVPALENAELAELQPVLASAQNHLFSGQIPQAVQEYDQLIQSGAYLQETIRDLREALYRYPVEIAIWEKLGDAYARANQLQEALDAYTKAEELLR